MRGSNITGGALGTGLSVPTSPVVHTGYAEKRPHYVPPGWLSAADRAVHDADERRRAANADRSRRAAATRRERREREAAAGVAPVKAGRGVPIAVTVDELVRDRAAGLSMRASARKHGCSHQAVARALRQHDAAVADAGSST